MDPGKEKKPRRNADPVSALPRSEPDGFQSDERSPHHPWHLLLNEFHASLCEPWVARRIEPGLYPAARRILDAPTPDRFLAAEAILSRRIWLQQQAHRQGAMDSGVRRFRDLLGRLSLLLHRRRPDATVGQAASLVSLLAWGIEETGSRHLEKDIPGLLRLCQQLVNPGQAPLPLQKALEQLLAALAPNALHDHESRGRARHRVKRVLSRLAVPPQTAGTVPFWERITFDRRDSWALPMADFLAGLDDARGSAWHHLLEHASMAPGLMLPPQWFLKAERLTEAVGREHFRQRVLELFPLVRLAKGARCDVIKQGSSNAALLKGLVLFCANFHDEQILHGVSHLAEQCFQPGTEMSVTVGSACLAVLGRLPGLAPVAQLSRLRAKLRHGVALRLIDGALKKAAEERVLSPDDLEEITVPTYGLDETGCLRSDFGEFTAELKIVGTHSTQLRWLRAGGELQKSVPSAVTRAHPAQLKDFRRTRRDIEEMLSAQRDRLERLLCLQREWTYTVWLERYHQSPLLSGLTRRLVWLFQEEGRSVLGGCHEGRLVDVEDRPLDWLGTATRVRLWHPLHSDVATVMAWRQWLERHQITQPFKQAHREVYLLTDAERQTGAYSNRFAAHIIRNSQFAGLARSRGWKYQPYERENRAFLHMPRHGLTAEFWFDGVAGAGPARRISVTYEHLSTDQVRFRGDNDDPRQLVDVPPLVFTEVMRDVDLFVSLCSVGNDPAWRDTGQREVRHYWERWSFGDLNATAVTRRQTLECLLPRLKIAGQCSLEQKFLVVRGSLHTYKIHLGSGNIMMEPDGRYLCIVEDRGDLGARQGGDYFLPFEGDGMLTVILSKAFLLAQDHTIKDRTIVSQLRAG